MPALLLFILVVVLIVHIGFWDTLGAILGAVAMFALLAILVALIAAAGVWLAYRRMRGSV